MAGKSFLFPFFIFILFFLSGCAKQEQADFSKYISGYTDGIIKSASSVSIRLNEKPDKGFQPGTTLPREILKITPSIKGELTLKEDNTIEFVPQERFRNGTTYKAVFDLEALSNVPAEFGKFNFSFKVIPLSTLYEAGSLTAGNNDSTLTFQATLVSSDDIAPEELENKVGISFGKEKITPEWLHEGNRHKLTVRNLRKGEETKKLDLSFTKDITPGQKETIDIPKMNEFTVLDVKAGNSHPVVVSVFMSEKVDPNQDLRGLINIPNTPALSSKIEGSVISLYTNSNGEGGLLDLQIHPGIRSTNGNILQTEYVRSIQLPSTKPAVRLIGKGVIIPGENNVVIPFSSVALKAIDLEIIRIPDQNMNFFLQENTYDDRRELNRTGRPIFMKKIDLQKDHPNIDLTRWNDFTINLSDLVKLEKGIIYRFRLKFKKSYTTLDCANEGPDPESRNTDNWDNPNYYYSEYEYPVGYDWNEENNPCHVSYYTGERFASRNIINTSLGLLAKRGEDNRYFICVTDLATAAPVADCDISIYNYQNQKIDSARTDKNGFANVRPNGKAFIVQAQKDKDRAWLRVAESSALSLSNFDISGQHVQMGVKGFIYGERGVWRPGDNIYLSMILEDKLQVLPQGHPIVAQLIDPNGNTIQTQKSEIGRNNIHCFTFKTGEDAPTGYWNAVFRVGGLTFTQTLRVETVKANRLAINLNFSNENIIGNGVSTEPVKVSTKWLNGAPTSNLKAITEVRLYNGNGKFPEFPDYTFTDKSKYFEPNTETLFDDKTDASGNYSFSLNKIKAENAPGVLNASFTTRVFENGGDFSINSQTIRYSPYKQYVGIRLPETDDNWYSTQSPVRLSGVTVTPEGRKSGNPTIKIEVFRLTWHWWWDSEDENLSSYINRDYSESMIRKNVTAVNGTFSADLDINEYGRYFIRATDPSGHSSGIIAYFGSWNSAANNDIATMLHLSTDKKVYKTGEKIKVQIPSSEGSVAIVSLENGKSISEIFRIPAKAGSTTVEVKATSDMCPNTYICVSLIQPYKDRDNDHPIRLYGVVNVSVEDPGLHLNPEVKVATELRPSKDFTVEVKEKNGKAMNYTIAVVDEGLLSLTTFRTPDPFSTFYAREALGVKTWDFYDYIYGAYGARLDKAFAVGGDEALKSIQDEKTNRFKPVVIFDGPFTLKAGGKQSHTFRMPEYIGEVRTMVIAATNGQYGSVAANSTVNNPLMLSVAMPRLFTPGDIIDIPVTVFAMKDNIRDVTVKMSTDTKITLLEETSKTIHFTEKGEQVVYFKVKINTETGVSTLRTEATSGQEQASATEDVTIRVPNPRITHVEEKEVKARESVSFNATLSGAEPLSVLEISSIPPLNLEQRLSELIEYPHGCIEQITSQAFPQLVLGDLLTLNDAQKTQTENNVKTVIARLRTYQMPEGGFAYWPGQTYVSDWGTTYAIQFLVAAQQQGYSVPLQMIENAINYTKRVANSWNVTSPWSQQQQAYRLYVLALANKPDMAAMNRLKESQVKEAIPLWLLASAYELAGHHPVAENMIRDIAREVTPYRQTGGTFGSDTRDMAIILQTLVTMNMQQDAYRVLEKISRAMGSNKWYSTQETAFSLYAAALYVKKFLGSQNGIKVIITTPSGKGNVQIEKTVYQQKLKLQEGKASAEVKNNGQGNLYARLINSSAPLEVVTEKVMSGLSMSVRYYNTNGTPLDIENLRQGEDVTTEITVKNTGITGAYSELVLSYLVPSGFEIINERLTGNANAYPGAENTDIRDDRFYIYFNLNQEQAKTFKFRCNAAFRGEYQLPAINCSAMYDNSIQALLPGGKITIK